MAAAGDVGRAPRSVADATHELYRQYGRQIYAYCLHQLRSREEAEDAVQTTFLNAFRGLQRGTTTRFEQAWLYKIAQNVCIARRSSSGRRLKLEAPDDFELLQEVVPAGNAAVDGDTLELMGLDAALDSMPENQRRAILLREWQGLSYREIATELGLSQGAVEMLIFRARRTLAQALEQPDVADRKRRRAKTGFSFGSLIAAMKSLFSGGAALKMAAVAVSAAVVGTNAVHTVVRKAAVGHPRSQGTAIAAPVAHVVPIAAAPRQLVAYRKPPAAAPAVPAVAAPATTHGPRETSSPGHKPVLVQDVASTPAAVTTPVASPPTAVPPPPAAASSSSAATGSVSSAPPSAGAAGGGAANQPEAPSKAPIVTVAPPAPTGGSGAPASVSSPGSDGNGSTAGPIDGGPSAHGGQHGDHGHGKGKGRGDDGGGRMTTNEPVATPYATLSSDSAAPGSPPGTIAGGTSADSGHHGDHGHDTTSSSDSTATTATTTTATTTTTTTAVTTTTTATSTTPTTTTAAPTTTTTTAAATTTTADGGGGSSSSGGDQGGPHHGDGGDNGNGNGNGGNAGWNGNGNGGGGHHGH